MIPGTPKDQFFLYWIEKISIYIHFPIVYKFDFLTFPELHVMMKHRFMGMKTDLQTRLDPSRPNKCKTFKFSPPFFFLGAPSLWLFVAPGLGRPPVLISAAHYRTEP